MTDALDLLRKAIDPAYWAREELGFEPDPWQVDALRADDRELMFMCCRQSGKSTIAAIKAVHFALYHPDAMIVLISPSQRQSSELFSKVRTKVIARLPDPPKLLEDNKTSLRMANGSRIVALPSSEETIVGYSAVNILIEDEAARVPDEIQAATVPMLATTGGQYIQLSTPRGKRGHFYKDWVAAKARQFKVVAADVPRITKAFLKWALDTLGSRKYAQEFNCEFLEDQEGDQFHREWFADKLVDDWPRDARAVRFWDKAATQAPKEAGDKKSEPDYTAGCLMAMKDGQFWIVDMRRAQLSSKGNRDLVRATAQLDGYGVRVRMEEEPGSSGKDTTDTYTREVLVGYNFKGVRSTGSKSLRAEPFAAACEAGNVFIVRGEWDYDGFLDRLCSFPSIDVKDDEVDAAAGAFKDLTQGRRGEDIPPEEASFRPSLGRAGRRR